MLVVPLDVILKSIKHVLGCQDGQSWHPNHFHEMGESYMKPTLQSILTLHPITIRRDQTDYIVEDSLSGEFYEMAQVSVDALEMINDGQTLGEIEYILKNRYPNEDVELIPFAKQLLKFGLVKAIDGHEVTSKKQNQSPTGLQWLPSPLGRFFFNPISNKLYILLFISNILLFAFNPSTLPKYKDIFVFDSMVFNALTYMAVSLVLIIIHEFGHILSIRAHNLPAKLEIGNRLFLVVFETDLTPAWKLLPKERNQLYFGGMAFEQVILTPAIGASVLLDPEGSLLPGIMGVVILDIAIKFIYQCCFYMKTDLYYVVENVTACYNLMERGRAFLSRLNPFTKTAQTTASSQDEPKAVRFYSMFYVCGLVLMFGLFVFFFLPQAFVALSRSVNHLLNYPASNLLFWDGVVFILQLAIVFGLLLFSINKNKRKA